MKAMMERWKLQELKDRMETHQSDMLLKAISSNYLDLFQRMLDNGILRRNVDAKMSDGSTALQNAVLHKRVGMIEKLMEAGADANVTDDNGNNCLHLAVIGGDFHVTSLILPKIRDVNKWNSRDWLTALHMAVVSKNRQIAKLLLDAGAHVNVHMWSGNFKTPLHFAVEYKNMEMIELLLDYHASPNLKNNEGISPFHYCIKKKDVSMVDLLLKHGANVNVSDNRGYNAIYFASHYADGEILEKLFKIPGANVQCCLQAAIETRDFDRVDYFLDRCVTTFNFKDAWISRTDANKVRLNPTRINDPLKIVTLLFRRGKRVERSDEASLPPQRYELLKNWQTEFGKLKMTKIYKDSRFNYQDLLTRRGFALVRCVRDGKVRDVIEIGEDKRLFFHYSGLLRENYSRGVRHWSLIKRFAEVLSEAVNKMLPVEVTLMIGEYLGEYELEKTFR